LTIQSKGRTVPEADPTEDAIDVRINCPTAAHVHQVFALRGDAFAVEVGLNFSVVGKEQGHIDDEVSKDRKVGKGLDQNRFPQEIFDVSAASENQSPIHSHRTRATDGPPAGVPKGQAPVLFFLNAQQRLQKVHLFPRLQMEGLKPF
jgi:hypothetical protein